MNSLTFTPLLPWTVLGAVVLFGLLLLGFAIAGRARGLGWRFAAFAVLALALANPSLVREVREPRDDVAVVVVDRSASQRAGRHLAATDAAVNRLRGQLSRFEGLDVREIAVVDDTGGTRLFAAVERALAEVPEGRLAGVVLITDGQVHDIPPQPPKGPIHVLLSGRPGETDRRLMIDRAPSYAIVGSTAEAVFRIEDRGPGEGRGDTVMVRRYFDGREAAPLAVPVGQPQHLSIPVEHAGPLVVELEAEAAPGELTLANNRAVIAVNGVRDRLRVLLISGQPHPGERMWRNLLKADPAVDLVHFTILRPPEKEDFTPLNELSLIAFPVQELFETRLGEFDLIVLDRYMVRGVLAPNHWRNIATYVEKGGALLLALGPEFASPLHSVAGTGLARVLPMQPSGRIVEEGFTPGLSDLGRRHPVTAALDGGSGWGRWFRQVEGTPERGDVLMEGPAGPLLVLDRIQEGRVAELMSDHVWLWARGFEGGGPHGELLRRLSHWLMREPDLEEERLTARIESGNLVVERRSLRETFPEVSVTSPSGERRTARLAPAASGLARAVVEAGETGLYRIEDGTLTALAASGTANPVEMNDLRASADLLAPLVKVGGGGIAWLADGMPGFRRIAPGDAAAGRDWMGLVANGAYAVTGSLQRPLLPGLVLMMLAVGLVVAAWWREGR